MDKIEIMEKAMRDLREARWHEQQYEPANQIPDASSSELAQAAKQALEDAGFVIVPKVPSEAMYLAAYGSDLWGSDFHPKRRFSDAIYTAMIAAGEGA